MTREELQEILEDIQPGPGQNVLIRLGDKDVDFRVLYDDWGTYMIPLAEEEA